MDKEGVSNDSDSDAEFAELHRKVSIAKIDEASDEETGHSK